MKKDLDFARDIAIDPEQLDVEAVGQASLFFTYADAAVEARAEADRAKLALETIEAELDARARKDPTRFGLVKATEPGIAAAIRVHQKYLDAMEALIDAKRTAALMDKAVDALEQRKRMIETLATLHGQQYFSTPKMHDIGEAYRARKRARELDITERQKARIARSARKHGRVKRNRG